MSYNNNVRNIRVVLQSYMGYNWSAHEQKPEIIGISIGLSK